MEKRQSNYFNMAKAVCSIFINEKAVWGTNELLSASFNRLMNLCTKIGEAAAKQQENAPEGHTAAKEAMRTELEDRLFNICRKLHAFSRLENDTVAEMRSDFSRTSLDVLSLNNLISLTRSIAEMCKERLEKLKPFGIDNTTLAVLLAGADKLAELNANRDTVMDYRMENTSSIINLLSKTRQELKTMDALVEGFVDDEAFLTVYFNARRIHDLRGKKRIN